MGERYLLPARLDLSASTALASDLTGRLDADLTLDAAEVTQIGALCTQVIAAAAISLRENGHSLTLVNAPDRVVDQLGNLGFTPESLAEVGA
jgi:chemotaxis protein CheX